MIAPGLLDGRKGNFMQCWSGGVYYPLDPHPKEVKIEDIAHHLSMICRFTGACNKFYSVAEHSVHVSRIVPPKLALLGLLHDATEAYLSDLNRPLKHDPEMVAYRRIERLNWCIISMCFCLPLEMPQAIHDADAAMLYAERLALMKPLPENTVREWLMGDVVEPAPVQIEGWSWRHARREFMDRYEELTR